MLRVPEDKEILSGLITCVDVQKLFNRSDQSIAIWRKSYGLPYVVIPSEGRAAVRYRLSNIVRWAETAEKELNAEFLKHLKQLKLETDFPPAVKSRPRRRFAAIA